MRDIKFRVWDSWQKRMMPMEAARLEVWRDDTCDPDNEYDFCFRYILLASDGDICVYDHEHGFHGNPTSKDGNRYFPLFWTGLLDKNGVEIYEGDIIALREFVGSCIGEIRWNDKGADFIFYNGINWRMPELPAGACEVVGNIYENPELLNT